MSQHEIALMSIGEAAKSIGITRRMILNYEDKGLLQPDKKDGVSGNRYYTADSITKIRTIRILQNLGLSLDDILAYYNGQTDLRPLIARLEKLRDEITQNIEKLRERVKSENDFEIRTVMFPAQTVYVQTMRTSSIEDKAEILRKIFMTAIKLYGSDTSKRMFFIEYHADDPGLVSYSIAVPPISKGEDIKNLPEQKALCIFYHGAYEELPDIRDKIIAYAKENGIRTNGICRHIYLEGPPHHKDPDKFITQVAVTLE